MIRAILTSGSMRSLRHKPDRSWATKPGHISCHRHGGCGGLRAVFERGQLSGLPLERRSEPRLQSARQIRSIGAFNKRLAGARPVQPIMFGDQVVSDSLAHLRHALDGFDPLVLAGVAERGRAAQDLLSHTFRCGPDGGQQRLPLLTLIQLTACQSRKAVDLRPWPAGGGAPSSFLSRKAYAGDSTICPYFHP